MFAHLYAEPRACLYKKRYAHLRTLNPKVSPPPPFSPAHTILPSEGLVSSLATVIYRQFLQLLPPGESFQEYHLSILEPLLRVTSLLFFSWWGIPLTCPFISVESSLMAVGRDAWGAVSSPRFRDCGLLGALFFSALSHCDCTRAVATGY